VVGGRERKTVSVLFCDLVGFTAASDGADPEDVQARLSPYYARARTVVERFGGTVEKFIGDAVMAAFGAPVVHEDDPERAVRAGLALLAAVADLNAELGMDLAVRVGVATGQAVVSTGARPERGEGMLAGDVVNTAARLQAAAPVGAVLVGKATRDSTQAAIEYAPHDPVTVKGKADALLVWLALGSRGSPGEALADTSRPMIGRSDELGALERAFSRAIRESSVQLVTVVAEPGLGKSRLVQAFADWVDSRDELIAWRQGHCPPYGDAVTYAALAQIVKAQCGILDTDAPDAATSRLTDTVHVLVDGTDLASQESWLVARLAPLVGLPSTEASQEEFFTAWRRFLEALAVTGPLVLVIEDLHWADPAMLEFLTQLLDWVVGVPMTIIVTTRPELFDSTPAWGAGHRNNTTLTLAPLADTETAQLVTSLLGTQVLPADLHAALLARAAGNPLYTREYLTMVTEQKSLATDTSTVAALVDALPGSVQAVIAARLDTLPTQSKRLLQAAAVIGHTFWVGAITGLTAMEKGTVASRLHDLVRRDYLRRSRVSSIAGEAEYVFTHALIADVAYSQLPRDTRASDHRRAGDWHVNVSSPADDTTAASGGRAAVIAHHYTEAHSLTSAVGRDRAELAELSVLAADWHARAARQVQQVDLGAAESHTLAALDLVPAGSPDRAGLLILLGETAHNAGRAHEAESAFRQARDEFEAHGDPVGTAIAEVRRSGVLLKLAHLGEAAQLIDQAVTVLERYPPGQELLDAYVASVFIFRWQGLSRQALARADQAVQLAERLDDPPAELVAKALRHRGGSRSWSGDPSAEGDLQKALELARAHNLTYTMLNTLHDLAVLKCFNESPQAGIPYQEEVIALAVERGRKSFVVIESADLAESLTDAGHIDEALALCERAAEALPDTDDPLFALRLHECWARVLTIRGSFDQASALVAEAMPVARRADPVSMVDLLLTAISCGFVSGDLDTGATLVDELVSTLHDPDVDAELSQLLGRLARVLAPAGYSSLLARIAHHTPPGLLLYDNQLLSARAIIAETEARDERAVELYAQAATAWASFHCPLEQAYALLGAARCSGALGTPARHRLAREARDIARQLGALPLVTEAEHQLHDVPEPGEGR
jgi:class 3 adenylate cyclase/tetratricopeptide (TPR) repeat protein